MEILEMALRVFAVIVLGVVVRYLIMRLMGKLQAHLLKTRQGEGESPTESSKRVETLTRLIQQTLIITLWVGIVLVILGQVGVDIGPLLAGAGIAGLAIGFGAQNLVRDFISGFFIIMENQVRVGDVAIINGTGGLVEKINLRTIILRDLSGVVHIFPNGAISSLSNMTSEWSAHVYEIGVAYKEDTDKVSQVIDDTIAEMLEDGEYGKEIIEHERFGVEKFGDSAVIIKGRIKTRPIKQWFVMREFNRRLKYAFDERGIEIPFPHRTLYFGEESKPFALEMLNDMKGESSDKAA